MKKATFCEYSETKRKDPFLNDSEATMRIATERLSFIFNIKMELESLKDLAYYRRREEEPYIRKVVSFLRETLSELAKMVYDRYVCAIAEEDKGNSPAFTLPYRLLI